jgi:hypothetical protein
MFIHCYLKQVGHYCSSVFNSVNQIGTVQLVRLQRVQEVGVKGKSLVDYLIVLFDGRDIRQLARVERSGKQFLSHALVDFVINEAEPAFNQGILLIDGVEAYHYLLQQGNRFTYI